MKNLNFKERAAQITVQRQRLALAKTDQESQISHEASNDPDVLNDGPHANLELTEKISFGEEVKAEISNEGEPFKQRPLTMKELLFQKNKDNPLKLIQISQKAKKLSAMEALAKQVDGKKRSALADAKSMVEEQQPVADREEESAECETFEETSSAPETSVPEVHIISNDSDVRTDGLHTCEEATEQASHSEKAMPAISDEVEPTEETLPSMKEILLQKSKEKALRLVAVPQGKEPTFMRRMLDENKARKERRALAEARAKAEEQESIGDDEDESAEVTTCEDTPANPETTSSPEVNSITDDTMETGMAEEEEQAEPQALAHEENEPPLDKEGELADVQTSKDETKAPAGNRFTQTAPIVWGKKIPYPTHTFGSLAPMVLLSGKSVQVDPEMIGSSLIGMVSAV